MAVKVDEEKCTGCGICVDSCGVEAIKIENDKAIISEDCVECSACISECPQEAISPEE
ncbi:4Fe-4S binding protein [bacterium]|nr:4Fe-4S binding protein [bacterium]